MNSRCYKLQPQDEFLRDNISKDDILIVSIGGNDVALAPSPCTIATMVGMTYCLPQIAIENGFTCCSIPVSRGKIENIKAHVRYHYLIVVPLERLTTTVLVVPHRLLLVGEHVLLASATFDICLAHGMFFLCMNEADDFSCRN